MKNGNGLSAAEIGKGARASELINELANGFADAPPDVQQKGIAAMTELIEAATDETSKDRLIYYRSIFEFVQTQETSGEKCELMKRSADVCRKRD